MPLPTSGVIPDRWAARHRPTVAGFFCDTVTVERKTGAVTTDALGTETPVWETIATGVPALVQVSAAGQQDTAGQPIIVSDYLGRISVGRDIRPGDRVTVTGSPDPANLGVYIAITVESQGHVVDRTIHLQRVI